MVRETTGPTGVAVQLEEDYEESFPIGGPHGGTLKLMAHAVESLEKFCSLPQSDRRSG
jgi:hypothetical protein